MPVMAQHFTVNSKFEESYALLLNLEFEKADNLIKELKVDDKSNLASFYLEDLSDFLYIVVSENQVEFEKRKDHRSERLNQLSKLPNDSPYKLLAIGEVHLHWAFSKMRFGEYLSGARDINKAFHALESNVRKFPDFLPTYKSMGLLHTLIGTVPENYRWATNLMGVDGTIEQGVLEMESVIQKSEAKKKLQNLRKETLFLLTFLHINLLNDSEALLKYQQYLQSENGPLMDFAKASLLKELGKTDDAILVLESSATATKLFPYLNFLLGEMRLSKMDKNADQSLIEYTKSFQGNSYLKAAYQKLAWHALLVKNDPALYKKMMQKIDGVGNTMLDEDKAAQKEFDSAKTPQKSLLKARLQFDGGYYKNALTTLISAKTDGFTEEDQLEFMYRLGRIHDRLENHKEAISYYQLTIKTGAESKRYFAANSSLMLGLLQERLGNNEKAKHAFQACTSFNNTEYRNSINQKAKAGLIRLSD